MNALDKVRAEVERLKKCNHRMADNAINSNMRNFFDGEEDCCKQLLAFIDSLTDEPVAEGLDEEIDRYLEPLRPCDIKEAPFTSMENIARHFAEWQKEQMMKGAVEGEIMTNGFYPYEPRVVASVPGTPFEFGDKVKLIVVKED